MAELTFSFHYWLLKSLKTGINILSVGIILLNSVNIFRVRGSLGTIITVSANIGILMAFIAGDLISYATFPVYLIAMPVIFLLVFISFPESPIYLMMMNRPKVKYKIVYFAR